MHFGTYPSGRGLALSDGASHVIIIGLEREMYALVRRALPADGPERTVGAFLPPLRWRLHCLSLKHPYLGSARGTCNQCGKESAGESLGVIDLVLRAGNAPSPPQKPSRPTTSFLHVHSSTSYRFGIRTTYYRELAPRLRGPGIVRRKFTKPPVERQDHFQLIAPYKCVECLMPLRPAPCLSPAPFLPPSASLQRFGARLSRSRVSSVLKMVHIIVRVGEADLDVVVVGIRRNRVRIPRNDTGLVRRPGEFAATNRSGCTAAR